MKDYLADLVDHINTLGNMSFVKLSGTEDGTIIEGVSDDKTVVVEGAFKNPIADFIGVFGMQNLGKLAVILGIPEYAENAKIDIVREKDIPAKITFVNKTGDFKNEFRFLNTEIANAKLKSVTFKGVKWNVTFQPTVASIQRFKYQNQATNETPYFSVKTNKKDLMVYMGDVSSHAGEFVFQADVDGTLARQWNWPVAPVLTMLNLVGDKTMMISDQGALRITVDSGLAVYNYTLPAQTK